MATVTKKFSTNLLPEDKRKEFLEVQARIQELQKTRENHFGTNLDVLWNDADMDYQPHRLKNRGTTVMGQGDEDTGWRGTSKVVELGSNNWQSDISVANVMVKIQVALATLIDQNPTGIFTATSQRWQAASALIKQLYNRSWSYAKSIYQLKLFVFNLCKYGWAVGRSYPLRIEREVQVMTGYDPKDPNGETYEKKKVVEYNDIYRENLDPRNVWIDDMARPNNERSIRDWAWRKVYTYDDAKVEFGMYPLFDLVPEEGGGIVADTIKDKTTTKSSTKTYQAKKLVEVYFYENRVKDQWHVHIAGVPVCMKPLPIADRKGAKKLSLWQTYWMLRHSESIHGIGIYEAIRYDQALMDRLSNMTIDQVTLAIYKMFFYQGTQNLQETGQITIQPGVGKQVIDPKNITWLNVPGPGPEAWQAISMIKNRIDEASAVTDPLLGVVTGKTAFELAQAKESALNRLKGPFDNILEALETEGYITICLMQLLYSVPETLVIADPKLINDYMQEIKADQELYDRVTHTAEDGTQTTDFVAKIYPEFPLNLDQDEQGNLIETEKTQFFRIKPKMLDWEGIINIKAQSILTPSKQIDKAVNLEFYNMFIPLLTSLAQERQMGATPDGQQPSIDELPHGKAAKELVKLYDKDPKELMPESWFAEPKPATPPQAPDQGQGPMINGQPLFVPAGGSAGTGTVPASLGSGQAPQAPGGPQPGQGAPLFVPSANAPQQPTSMAGKIISRLTAPLERHDSSPRQSQSTTPDVLT